MSTASTDGFPCQDQLHLVTEEGWFEPDLPTASLVLDGASTTSLDEMLQRQILTALDVEPVRGCNMDGLHDDVGWNARGADVVGVNVARARARAGHDAVEYVLACFAERLADDARYAPVQHRMALVLQE